jgi:hypothetical protein
MIKVGDKVRKKTGYAFDGEVVAVCNIDGYGTRVIVKQLDWFDDSGRRISGGALHIVSPEQLEVDNSGTQ